MAISIALKNAFTNAKQVFHDTASAYKHWDCGLGMQGLSCKQFAPWLPLRNLPGDSWYILQSIDDVLIFSAIVMQREEILRIIYICFATHVRAHREL